LGSINRGVFHCFLLRPCVTIVVAIGIPLSSFTNSHLRVKKNQSVYNLTKHVPLDLIIHGRPHGKIVVNEVEQRLEDLEIWQSPSGKVSDNWIEKRLVSGQRQLKLRQNITGQLAYSVHSASACFRHTNPPSSTELFDSYVIMPVTWAGHSTQFWLGNGLSEIPNIAWKLVGRGRVWCSLCRYLDVLRGSHPHGNLGPLGTGYHIGHHNFLLSNCCLGLGPPQPGWMCRHQSAEASGSVPQRGVRAEVIISRPTGCKHPLVLGTIEPHPQTRKRSPWTPAEVIPSHSAQQFELCVKRVNSSSRNEPSNSLETRATSCTSASHHAKDLRCGR
jgi:hypothetical protein